MEGVRNKDYVVDKVVGKGPQGNVYKAKRVSDGAICAIKEFCVRHLTEEEKENVVEEVRILTTVHNENVITYYESFVHEDKVFVVLEHCADPDLGKQIKSRADQRKFFTEGQIWSYFIQMLRGLVALHSNGILYRNMRSANVIQVDSKVVKLGDVGVGNLTMEGPLAAQIGNPHYVPPEVWTNQSYTFKSDMWALGCVLYELIALTVPFGGCSLPDLRLKAIKGIYPPVPSSFSSRLGTVLKLLLNPDQTARISARDMLLHPILQAHLQHAPAPAPLLRSQYSVENIRLGSISGLSMFGTSTSSYPTLAVASNTDSIQSQALNVKPTAAGPAEIQHQSGLSKEKSTSTSVRSKVAPILAPRAVLSSPNNDKMVSELNRPSNEALKVKIPRVATLGKNTPRASESSIGLPPPPHGLQGAVSPRINLKSFKTAYIQTPKTDSDEFPAVRTPGKPDRSDSMKKEKLDRPLEAPGTPRITLSTATNVVTLRKEKSGGSVRSVASSQSDDSVIRVRATVDDLESSYIRVEHPVDVLGMPKIEPLTASNKVATPRKEKSGGSVRSVASSQSDDLATRIRAPLDDMESSYIRVEHYGDVPGIAKVKPLATPTKANTPRRGNSVGSLRSVGSVASGQSNDSVCRIRAPINNLEPNYFKVDEPIRGKVIESGGSSRNGSDDLDSLVRVPFHLFDTGDANVTLLPRGDSAKSEQSIASHESNGSATIAGRKVQETASAQWPEDFLESRMAGSTDLPTFNPHTDSGGLSICGIELQKSEGAVGIKEISSASPASEHVIIATSTGDGGDRLVKQNSEESARVDRPESLERLDDSAGNELLFKSATGSTLNCTSNTSSASVADQEPISVQNPATGRSKAVRSIAVDGVAKKRAGDAVKSGRGSTFGSVAPRRLSLDGVKKEMLEKHAVVSKMNSVPFHERLAIPKHANSAESMKSGAGDKLAAGQSKYLVSRVGGGVSCSSQGSQKLTENKHLSKEKSDPQTTTAGVSKMKTSDARVSSSRRESSVSSLKSGTRSVVASKGPSALATPTRTDADGAVSARNPPNASSQQHSSFEDVRKENTITQKRTSGVSKVKPVIGPAKPIIPRENSAASLEVGPRGGTSRRENAAGSVTPLSSNGVALSHHADDSIIGGRSDGTHPLPRQQGPAQGRRFSLDFQSKQEKRIHQPSRRGVVPTAVSTARAT